MPLPDFILAGAPKSGSSSLWRYLRQHPEIFLPDEKELFFFDFKFDRGLDWYSSKFNGALPSQMVGEATVWYMRWSTVPERIFSTLPNVKLIFILRNPIDRAYSNWCHEKRDGVHPLRESFDEFLKRPDRDSRTIISSGHYALHLERWLKFFRPDQIYVDFYENLDRNPQMLLANLFDFLGIEDISGDIDLSKRDNVSWWFGATWPIELVEVLSWPAERLTGVNPVQTAWRKSRHLRQIFYDRSKRPPRMSDAARSELALHYSPHNKRLADVLGRPLPDWS